MLLTLFQTELRALCVALGNDLAYVVQAIAPNFVWKTADFPRAEKGYHYSISMSSHYNDRALDSNT